jgi:hypothetical protein
MVAVGPLGKALVDQTGIAWRLARAHLVGLDDEEFFWEPVQNCWSLRLKSEIHAVPEDAAGGDWWIDGGLPEPDPPPFTTIAWLVSHMILGTWNWNDIIAGQPVAPEPALLASTNEAVGLWDQVITRFEEMVDAFSDEELTDQVPAWGGLVARSFLVSHVVAEVLHHSAEVGRLRDLYRNRHSLAVGPA